MIALEPGVCGDENVLVGAPYLARIGHRYLVVVPFCPDGTSQPEIPWSRAVYIDPLDKTTKPVSGLHEMCQIF